MEATLTAHHFEDTAERAPRIGLGSSIVVAIMMAAAPVVAWQGPVHTTVMDPIIIVFLTTYWARMVAHRATLPWPLIGAFWAIITGSLIALFWNSDVSVAALVLAQDVYLYLWFVTTVHFFVFCSRMDVVALTYVAVACIISVMGTVDHYTHAFGGIFTATARAVGTFENPNMFGNYLNIGIFLAWAVGKGGRRIAYAAIPVLLAGVVATGSNGTMLSLIVASAVVVATYPSRQWAERIGLLLILAALAIAILGNWDERWTNAALQRMTSGRAQIGGSAVEGAEDRIPIWLDAIESLKEHPLGVGPANFNRLGGPISKGYHGPHNEYVGMLVERGPIGVAGWIAMLVLLALGVHAARAVSGALPLAVEPLFGVVAVIAIHAGTMEVFHFRHVWMAFAVVAAASFNATLIRRGTLPATSYREAA